MRPEFVRLHYPLCWHYDFLGGLKAMVQIGSDWCWRLVGTHSD